MPDRMAECVAELVTANHILVGQGVVDGFGHVSMRHPERADRFLLSRNCAPALVQADDILEFNLDASAVVADGPRPYLERFIHAALYRARPEIGAVVHSHSRSVIPFGTAHGACLRPVSHMAGFLCEAVPLFEIRDFAGTGSDLLIRDNALGDHLAQVMGESEVVLMRGHGVTVVGRTVQQAVFQAVYTEWNASIQAQTMALGEPVYMTREEANAAAESNNGQVGRAWDYWAMLAGKGLRG